MSGIALSGADAGNYTFNTTANTTADITQRALAVSATGINKVYDGNTTAGVTLADNRITGDVLTVTDTAANFANKNAGTAKTISVSGIALSGADAGNYSFNTTAGTTADITQRALAVTATGINKVYDGTTTAGVTLADNRITGDMLTVTDTAANFANKNAGTAKPISVTGIALAGADAGNYTVNTTASSTADIRPKTLTATATAPNKVYDGNTTAAATLSVTSGLVGAETLIATGLSTFNSKNVATANLVTVNSIVLANGANGGLATNYALTSGQTAPAYITRRPLNVTATGINKVFDNTTTATVTLGDNRVAGDVLAPAYTAANFDTKNVGTGKTVTVTGINVSGADAGNYSPNTTASTTANITAPTGQTCIPNRNRACP